METVGRVELEGRLAVSQMTSIFFRSSSGNLCWTVAKPVILIPKRSKTGTQ
jgi:hypothetical protein